MPGGVFLIGMAVLSLRWPWHVSLDTLRGRGHVDLTIVAFVASFGMIALSLPGYAAVVAGAHGSSRQSRIALVGSLLLMVIGCLSSLLWIVTSIRAIGGTLAALQVVQEVFPPTVTAVSAAVLRFRFPSERRDLIL